MNTIMTINDMAFSYGDKVIFEKFNLDIKRGTFLTILGSNMCGKSTLAKIMTKKLKYKGLITLNEKNIAQISLHDYNKIVTLINGDIKVNMKKTVYDVLYQNDVINSDSEIDCLLNDLHIMNLKYRCLSELSSSEFSMVCIAIGLTKNSKVIIIDNIFTTLTTYYKEIVFKKLRKLHRLGTTIINITSDVEESLNSKEIAIVDKNVIIKNNLREVYVNEKILKDNSLKLPFVVDLSMKLNYYGIVDTIFLSENKLVKYIWK